MALSDLYFVICAWGRWVLGSNRPILLLCKENTMATIGHLLTSGSSLCPPSSSVFFFFANGRRRQALPRFATVYAVRVF